MSNKYPSRPKDYLSMSTGERIYAEMKHFSDVTRKQRPILINDLQQLGAKRLSELKNELTVEISKMISEIQNLDTHTLATEVYDLQASHAQLSARLKSFKREQS